LQFYFSIISGRWNDDKNFGKTILAAAENKSLTFSKWDLFCLCYEIQPCGVTLLHSGELQDTISGKREKIRAE